MSSNTDSEAKVTLEQTERVPLDKNLECQLLQNTDAENISENTNVDLNDKVNIICDHHGTDHIDEICDEVENENAELDHLIQQKRLLEELDLPENETEVEDENAELDSLIQQKRLLEEQARLEEAELQAYEQAMIEHMENLCNNLNIFATWMKHMYAEENLYQKFRDNFSTEYICELFDNVYEVFLDNTVVTDEILFYWKCILHCLLRNSKKYRSYLGDLVFDLNTRETNLVMNQEKHIFKCFIGKEFICYFKENGTDYYVS